GRRYRAHACRATGRERAVVFSRSRSFLTRTIYLPDLHDRTRALERGRDPGVTVVKERLGPRQAVGACIRRKYGDTAALSGQRRQEHHRCWGLVIVPFQDEER